MCANITIVGVVVAVTVTVTVVVVVDLASQVMERNRKILDIENMIEEVELGEGILLSIENI